MKSVEKSHGDHLEALIPIGEPAQIQVDKKKYSTYIRGIVPPRWMFLDMPRRDGRLVSLPRGKAALVRYINQGVMFGFRTLVNHEYLAPQQLLVVEYPKSIEERNLRKSERIKTFIPVRIMLEENAEPMEGAALDLSREGALLSFGEEWLPEIGEMVWISLRLPSGDSVESLGCHVRNIREPRSLRLVGVEFDTEDTLKIEVMRRFYDYCVSPMG